MISGLKLKALREQCHVTWPASMYLSVITMAVLAMDAFSSMRYSTQVFLGSAGFVRV